MTADDDLHQWWDTLSVDLPSSVRGLWFGLTDLQSRSGAIVRTLYVSGSDSFSADDGGDWAADPSWGPENHYLVVPEIEAHESSDLAGVEETAVQLVTALAPQRASSAIDGVATGFDDGEAIIVWQRADPSSG